MDALLTLLVAAGVNFVMGVPGADDIMLGYQSTSFHDALAMRDLLHRRPAPEFEAWLQRQGLMDEAERIRPACHAQSLPRPPDGVTTMTREHRPEAMTARPPTGEEPRESVGPICAGSPPPASRSRAAVRRSPPDRCWTCGWPMPAHATPCTRRWTMHGSSRISPRSACPCSRWRARRRTASITSCVRISAAPWPRKPRRCWRHMLQPRYCHRRLRRGLRDLGRLVRARGAGSCRAAPGRGPSRLRSDSWSIAPLVVVRQGRVAIGDVIASALRARIVVMLIGERPGLSSPDSMGAYLTSLPAGRPLAETTDADRNCISNIRPEGLGYADAAFKLVHLLRAIRAQRNVRCAVEGRRRTAADRGAWCPDGQFAVIIAVST